MGFPLVHAAPVPTALTGRGVSVHRAHPGTSAGSNTRRLVLSARRLFSGIQPTGNLHLGNYVAAILPWVCVTPVGWLERMIQFKTRAAYLETIGTGLLAYPVLQAADILLYRAHFVPVGEDQEQHVELTREIARRFHALFGHAFTLPHAVIAHSGGRLMGLDDPSVKMSKSLAMIRKRHAIGLVDPPEQIRDAVMHALTDSGREVRPGETSPGVTNLLTIYQALSGRDQVAVNAEFAGKGYAALKSVVADLAIEKLAPIRARHRELSALPEALDAVLAMGAERARLAAAPTLDRAKLLIGLSKAAKRHAP
jgi:tryptophanyl-tRNA synthetase